MEEKLNKIKNELKESQAVNEEIKTVKKDQENRLEKALKNLAKVFTFFIIVYN